MRNLFLLDGIKHNNFTDSFESMLLKQFYTHLAVQQWVLLLTLKKLIN